jgi:dTMP kinase
MFVTFEGPEGAGKSTQVRRLAAFLQRHGVPVVTTREPGGTPLGERLREILLIDSLAPGPVAEAYLMTAARAEHVRQVSRPALERGDVVICDRFADSTLAYQGAGRGLPVDQLRELQVLAVGDCWPDVTILLDIDVRLGLERRGQDAEANRIDRETVCFHQRVAEWYRVEAARRPERWSVIQADRSEDDVEREVTRLMRAAPQLERYFHKAEPTR